MRNFPSTVFLASVLFLTGCTVFVTKDEVILDSAQRPPTHTIDVYKTTPVGRETKTIAEMTWFGPRSDELRAEKYFMARAGKLGANGIIFRIEDSGYEQHAGAFGANGVYGSSSSSSARYLFKAKAIVYEP